MLDNLTIYLQSGESLTWMYPMSTIMQSMRVRYPEVTLIRMKDDLYMLTINHETYLDSPRAICDMLLERDDMIASYEWNLSEVS